MSASRDPKEARFRERLSTAFAAPGPHGHLDPDLVAIHAANELTPEEAVEVTRHLAGCTDGTCLTLLRDAVASASVTRDLLYGVRRDEFTDPSLGHPQRQTAHTFECEDALWEMFARIAEDEGCSVDWVINEAMRAYLEQRQGPVAPRNVVVTPMPPPAMMSAGAGGFEPLVDRNTPTLQLAYVPSDSPFRARRRRTPSRPGGQRLAILFHGSRYVVDKDRFVIGRGGPSSDLAIDDPNVSRQHALIEHVQGVFYLVDMGSTNGIEIEGARITRKLVEHGDLFRIAGHELEIVFEA